MLSREVAPASDWRQRLAALLARYPGAAPSAMGFPAGWEASLLWV